MERTSRTLARPSHSHTPHTHSPFLYQQTPASLLPFHFFCCSLSSHSLIHTKTHHDNILSLPLSCSSGKGPFFKYFALPPLSFSSFLFFSFIFKLSKNIMDHINKYSPKNQSIPSIKITKLPPRTGHTHLSSFAIFLPSSTSSLSSYPS